MKICAITSFPPLQSGIARYSKNLYSELAKLTPMKLFKWNYETHLERLKAPYHKKEELKKLFTENDIIHIQYILGEYMFLFLPLISKIKKNSDAKLVMTLHEDYSNLAFSDKIKRFHNKYYDCADLLLVHSSNHRSQLPKELQEKTLITPFGTKLLKKNETKPKKNNSVLMIGFMNPWKGHDKAIKAIYLVKQKIPDIKLTIVGKPYDKRYTKKILELVDNLGLRDNVDIVLDYVSDEQYESYLRSTELTLLPYMRTTMSAVLSDVVGAGKPCIMSDLEQFKEYTQDRASYVNPDKPRDIAKEIISLLNDSEKRRKMTDSFESLALRYSWDSAARFTLDEYNRLFEKK